MTASFPTAELSLSLRDAVHPHSDRPGEEPLIASVSDIHGYHDAARNALLTPTDHADFDPIVTVGDDGQLHWAGENYVLVFNGDLIDRGPANEEVLELVTRLALEAPPGRVRVTLGNHEAIAMTPDRFGFSQWFSTQIGPEGRQALYESITAGQIIAAYEGYNVTYAHAGAPKPYDSHAVNESLSEAAETLLATLDSTGDAATQRRVVDEHQSVLGIGQGHPKGRGAGLVWLDFKHLPPDAPRQVVGHTRHASPQKKRNVYCQNVIRDTIDSPGGEALFLESPDSLVTLVRQETGETEVVKLDTFR